MRPIHIIISTHTTRHLRATLAGIAAQRPRPTGIILSIDNDLSEPSDLAIACSCEFALPMTIAWRARPSHVRVGQVRNNGVRALLSSPTQSPRAEAMLYFLDGDSVPAPGMIARAAQHAAHADLLIGGRICLTPRQTDQFDLTALPHAQPPVLIAPQQHLELDRRQRRYRRQQRLKHFGIIKMHKPKVLGASHGVSLSLYRAINGCDETYLGAWREDDDLGRRAHLAGARSRVALRDLCVYHLWHPMNPGKRQEWSELPEQCDLARCLVGLQSPAPQPPLFAQTVCDGRIVERWTVPDADSPLPTSPIDEQQRRDGFQQALDTWLTGGSQRRGRRSA